MSNESIFKKSENAWSAYLTGHLAAVQSAKQGIADAVLAAAEQIVQTFRTGHKLLLFGNGGSAADAQHIAAEFVGRFLAERAPLPAVALSVNTSILTALANDYGEAFVFSRQIAAIGQPGDLAIGISTSGSSENVLRGLVEAKSRGMKTVLLTGAACDETAAELCVRVPSTSTPHIQEVHIIIGHFLAGYAENELFGREHGTESIT